MIGVAPAQLPVVPESVWPSTTRPETTGSLLLTGAEVDVTVAVGLDDASAEPTLWIGTERGLVRHHAGHFELAADRERGLPSDAVWSLAARETAGGELTLWIGTYEGLVRHVEGPWVALTPDNTGLPHRVVMAILESRDTAGAPLYWVGTWGGAIPACS